jgi:hypothetical protein
MLQSEATLIDERKESIGTFKLEQHQLTVGDVHHDLPPSSLRDPIFGFDVPTECPGVPRGILWPRGVWADSSAYDTAAKKLADLGPA